MSALYPWQTPIWSQLHRDQTRLPHALLLHGRPGIGKFAFARSFSQALLCRAPTSTHMPCGQCASCHWFTDGTHPDFKLLTPAQDAEADELTTSSKKTKKKSNISVAQVRELAEYLTKSSHQSTGRKIVLLHPAETLNSASGNALLKMLEEPSDGVMFILVTHQIQRLLPTILSRCQQRAMTVPTEAEASAWLASQNIEQASAQLAYFEGSPLKVLDEQAQYVKMQEIWRHLAKGKRISPIEIAQSLLSINHASNSGAMDTSIMVIQKWLYDLVHLYFTGQVRYHPQLHSALQKLSENVHLKALFALNKSVLGMRKLASHPLNHELQLEAILQDYSKIFSK